MEEKLYTIEELKKIFYKGYLQHAQNFNMNINDGEFGNIEKYFYDLLNNEELYINQVII
jgi:hypothetical protein